MAQLKEIRTRINSIKNTRQVTSAMKMVSAAKLKKAQDVIMQLKPYNRKLKQVLDNIMTSGKTGGSSVYMIQPKIERVLIIVVGTNRGLCGAFNSNVVKLADKHVKDNYNEQKKAGNVFYMAMGKKVEAELKMKGLPVISEVNDIMEKPLFEEAASIARSIMKLFAKDNFQRVDFVYNNFRNAAMQYPVIEQFLPVSSSIKETDNLDLGNDYIIEPSVLEILNDLIPQSLRMNFYRILADSSAAEHGARMTAMHQATDNATDLIKELRMRYNNARQDAITNEIIEITSGADALD